MRRFHPLLILAAVLLVGAAALADQVVYFTNGTSMAIRGYEVEDEMIHVELGAEARMAFPFTMVERIEDAGKQVVFSQSTVKRQGRAAMTAGSSYDVGAAAVSSNRGGPRSPQTLHDPNIAAANNGRSRGNVGVDSNNGIYYHQPMAGVGHPGKARLKVVGDRAARQAAYATTPQRPQGAAIGGAGGVLGKRIIGSGEGSLNSRSPKATAVGMARRQGPSTSGDNTGSGKSEESSGDDSGSQD